MEKVCFKCKQSKSVDYFYKKTASKDGLGPRCKHCVRGWQDGYFPSEFVRLKQLVFDKLGCVCARCGFSDKRALQIDHVNGDGKIETKQGLARLKKVLEDSSGAFQILCANCNWIKRVENKEYHVGKSIYREPILTTAPAVQRTLIKSDSLDKRAGEGQHLRGQPSLNDGIEDKLRLKWSVRKGV